MKPNNTKINFAKARSNGEKPSLTGAPLYLVGLIYRYEPACILWSALNAAVSAVLPLLYVYAPKVILESLTGGKPFAEVLQAILLYGAVLLPLTLCGTAFANGAGHAADRFAKKLRYEIGRLTMSLPLSELDKASTSEAVKLAENAASATETLSYIGGTISNALTVAGLSYLIARLDAICLLSVLAVVMLKFALSGIQLRINSKARLLYAENNRNGDYLTCLAYFDPGAEKELRVGALRGWFMGKLKAYRRRMVELQYKDFGYSAVFEAVIAAAGAAQTFIVLTMLASGYIGGRLGIADFTMMFAAVTTLTASLSAFGDQLTQYRRQITKASDYKKLTTLRGAITAEPVESAADLPIKHDFDEISFHDVCFAYPGCESMALDNVNITLRSGEILVVAGPNGAGKSTFVKLLCKFYRPSSGSITLDGIDIWTIPNEKYYPLLAAVFQDYSVFAFTFAENIALSESADLYRISAILRELGMDKYRDKPETCISKIFSPDGIEPSGGEEQKLALARAIYKDAPLLILDEPTANLDAKAESGLYEDFLRLSGGRTSVFISHRLACSRSADKIAVFDGGHIVEYGSHAALIARGGLYARMYETQSVPYIGVPRE